jgi:rubrerythrin
MNVHSDEVHAPTTFKSRGSLNYLPKHNRIPPQSNVIPLSDKQPLLEMLVEALQAEVSASPKNIASVAHRIAVEVERICAKSDRIQNSGISESWRVGLARHRVSKCLYYYQLGSRQGRIELHSHLSAIVYRYISPPQAQLGFQARYTLIEDFLQEFYTESLKAFRRENDIQADYTPRGLLELAEYMVFTECYAKRKIHLRYGASQQLIVLRAQTFAKRQPSETTVDIEQAFETAKDEDGEVASKVMQQLRAKMVSDNVDPCENVLRDRVIKELIAYLEGQERQDCIDYLLLKLDDLSAPEIEKTLGLTTRQRDYLQQRFKYHVEKFARVANWELVHQWLGAEIDRKLGLTDLQWEKFAALLSVDQRNLLNLKQSNHSDLDIMKSLRLSEKKFQMRWSELLTLASQVRNQ